MKQENIEYIFKNPIIGAVSNEESLQEALNSPCDVLFILEGNIFRLKEEVNSIHKAGKLAFIHFDLMKGISHDNIGLEYMKTMINPDGIITTKASLIKKAKEFDLITIQRVFALDSKSIDKLLKSIYETKTDIIEVMPGAIPKVIKKIKKVTSIPIIAGGLIDEKSEIIELLDAGAIAISTSCKSLWDM